MNESKYPHQSTLLWGRTVSIMFVLTLLGQTLGFVRDAIIAAKFGAGVVTDAFFLAILLPNATLLFVQNGFTMAVVPTLVSKLATEGEELTQKIASNIINLTLCIVLIVCGCMLTFAEPIIKWLAPNLPMETHVLAVSMFRPLTLVGLFGGLATMLAALLNVYRQYTLPTLFSLIMNLSVVAGVLIFVDTLSWKALVGSTLAGHFIQILILLKPLSNIQRYSYIFHPRAPYLGQIITLAWPAIMLLLFQQIIVIVDRNIASSLGVGNVAALTFAARLVLPISALLIGPLATMTLPEMARATIVNNDEHTQHLASSIFRHTLFILLPVATLLYIVSDSLVSLVFQRGEFVQSSVELTANIMAFYVLTLVGLGIRQVIVRMFFAAQDSRVPLLSGAVRMIINLALNVVLARSVGIIGIAMASGVAIIIDVILMVGVMVRQKRLQIKLDFVSKILCAVILTTLVGTAVHKLIKAFTLIQPIFIENLVVVSLTTISIVTTYLGVSVLLRMPEKDIFINIVRRPFR